MKVLAAMAQDRRSSAPTQKPASLALDDVHQLAHKAIRRLATETIDPEDPLRRKLHRLCDAYLADSEAPRKKAMRLLRQEGITPDDIIDTIIPEVALILGRHWAEDTRSFADVTIGAARLQESVRRLGREALSTLRGNLSVNPRQQLSAREARVLLIIPRSEHHTLGAFIAADQLRRFGYEVDIAVDRSPPQIISMMQEHRYGMVGITVAGRRALASAKELVDIIRTTVTRVTPIVLGGSLVGTEIDLKGITGVDHVTNDIRTALNLCGLDMAQSAPPCGTEFDPAWD